MEVVTLGASVSMLFSMSASVGFCSKESILGFWVGLCERRGCFVGGILMVSLWERSI